MKRFADIWFAPMLWPFAFLDWATSFARDDWALFAVLLAVTTPIVVATILPAMALQAVFMLLGLVAAILNLTWRGCAWIYKTVTP